MDESKRYHQTVDEFYAGSLDDSQWSSALASLMSLADADGLYYVEADPQSGAVLAGHSINIDDGVLQSYASYYCSIDPRFEPPTRAMVGQMVTEWNCLDMREFTASEIYNDFLVPSDNPHMLASWISLDSHIGSAVSLQRSAARGPFEPADIDKLKGIIPHVVRSSELRHRLRAHRSELGMHVGILFGLQLPALLLDNSGYIIEVNSRAAELLSVDAPFRMQRRQIRSIVDDRSLQCAIARALAGEAPLPQKSAPASNGFSIVALPLPRLNFPMRGKAAVLMLLLDSNGPPLPTIEVLKITFGLSRAEASLILSLDSEGSVSAAAANLGISVNTAKTQLKSIYAKTGCRTHTALARLLRVAT